MEDGTICYYTCRVCVISIKSSHQVIFFSVMKMELTVSCSTEYVIFLLVSVSGSNAATPDLHPPSILRGSATLNLTGEPIARDSWATKEWAANSIATLQTELIWTIKQILWLRTLLCGCLDRKNTRRVDSGLEKQPHMPIGLHNQGTPPGSVGANIGVVVRGCKVGRSCKLRRLSCQGKVEAGPVSHPKQRQWEKVLQDKSELI